VRASIAEAVRSRVAGDVGAFTTEELFADPAPGWFHPDHPVWRVHADAAMFVGGLRALLLQSLHPRAMGGVAGHSDYRHDPWGRLQRTARFLALTTFGSAAQAEAAVAAVHRVHERVTGTTVDGEPYAANDPHLLAWVHVAEVESFLVAYQRFGEGDVLDPDEADAYVAGMARVARALGVVDPPRSVAELRARLRAYQPELRATPEARAGARFLLAPPALPVPALVPYGVLGVAAVSTLPWWSRLALRLPVPPVSPVTDRVWAPVAGRSLLAVLRWSGRGDGPGARRDPPARPRPPVPG
jgi:uncharacterized protein (DUF2236 family)